MPDMTPLNKIGAAYGLLDKLADAKGRVKCGYIWALTELLEGLQKDVEALTNPEKQPEQDIPEILQEEGES